MARCRVPALHHTVKTSRCENFPVWGQYHKCERDAFAFIDRRIHDLVSREIPKRDALCEPIGEPIADRQFLAVGRDDHAGSEFR